MTWPFGGSNKVAPTPGPRASLKPLKDNPLCLMFSTWNCNSRRLNGDGKRSCYCSLHTCEAPGCVDVVAGRKQRYCEKHQLNGLLPQPRAAAPAAAAPGAPGRQMMKKQALSPIIIQHRWKMEEETQAVVKAIGEVVEGERFRALWKKETSNRAQVWHGLSDNGWLDGSGWAGMAKYLEGEMNKYIVREKNFAAYFCQDLLLFCSCKVEQSHVKFVLYMTSLVAFPLLAPYLAILTGAAAAGGAIAAHAASTGVKVVKKAAEKGADVAAKHALGLQDRTQLTGRPEKLVKESQGRLNDVLEYFLTMRANPIIFARLLSRHLASYPSQPAEKLIVDHFGRGILNWDKLLTPGSFA